jgi:transposase
VLAESELTKTEISTIKSGEGGALAMGVSPMTECTLAPAIVAEFSRIWPKVKVTIVSARLWGFLHWPNTRNHRQACASTYRHQTKNMIYEPLFIKDLTCLHNDW